MSREYRVTWEIDVDGANPRDAARHALKLQRGHGSTATVFSVAGREYDINEPFNLDAAYLAELTARIERETDAARREFWQRLAGSVRKAGAMP